jgi:hypothetical protein
MGFRQFAKIAIEIVVVVRRPGHNEIKEGVLSL